MLKPSFPRCDTATVWRSRCTAVTTLAVVCLLLPVEAAAGTVYRDPNGAPDPSPEERFEQSAYVFVGQIQACEAVPGVALVNLTVRDNLKGDQVSGGAAVVYISMEQCTRFSPGDAHLFYFADNDRRDGVFHAAGAQASSTNSTKLGPEQEYGWGFDVNDWQTMPVDEVLALFRKLAKKPSPPASP